jgi:site-specific DNA recombinase
VQRTLSEKRAVRANQTRSKTTAVLKGLIRCECCDAAMAQTYTTRRGKRYHYYVCHAAAKKGYDTCEVRSVPGGQIEQAVFTYLRQIFADPAMVARTFRATRAQAAGQRRSLTRQKSALEKRLAELRKGIGRLVRAAGDKEDGRLAEELRKLNDEYTDVEAQMQQLEAQLDQQEEVPTERDVAEALRTVEPLWAELFPAEKERVVRLLVETVSIRPDGLTSRLRPTGLVALAAEVAPQESQELKPQEATA